jgi:Kef-type K+ transport system membrane component KefB
MEHNISLISTIAAAFGGALILGVIAERLKLPALVGYLLAGISSARRRRVLSPTSRQRRNCPKLALCC